ncbi:hypothetical protein E3O62_02620 [Cryobacterium sp. TMT2-15-1]|uniref:ERF family protein n=1 Tax=Cryobacterium sp. TMT2-15-1 TaxID=1259246 RepID=UPI00106D225B|nr:ERF family protein [Cryobacterium sp. TMT2-15-1]TFC63739.1 hypothetical protein E3O62_02620 [Cryobacterium sp. TMT2-15-1]
MANNSVEKPNLAKLASALVKFQGVVPIIPKNKTADAGKYSYKFADLADIFTAIREPMMANGLAVTQELSGGKDGWTQLETIVWHDSGEHKASLLDINTNGKSAQDAGSQFTYYKRYALGAALGIATEVDDDGKAAGAPNPPEQSAPNDPEEPKEDVLARAKKKIFDELEVQGYGTAVGKKAFIVRVLKHSTIDTLDEADLVMDQLENEAAEAPNDEGTL